MLAPTLTGSGDRAHLLTREVGLDTHVTDLVNVFEYEDIEDAVLVAHSYGGMVASGALEQIGDRVRFLVLLDGHMPRTGESVFDLNGPARADAMIALADEAGEGWFIPPATAGRYGVTDPVDAAWVEARMTAQPLKTYTDRIGATDRMWSHRGMFVECVPSSLEPHLLARARARAAADPSFAYRVLPAAHNAMVTAPDALADLLLGVVRSPTGTELARAPSPE